MSSTVRVNGGAIIVLAVALALGWLVYALFPRPAPDKATTEVTTTEVPVIMRTPGGLLEVATVRAQERFTRSDTRDFWGLPLGTTVSHIEVPALYRYHIELARDWHLLISGRTAYVRSPALEPSLPVAFDTGAMRKYTRSGWARFDKQENLDALERTLTRELDARANSDRYRRLATEAARQTVREFVTRWLLKEQHWKRDSAYTVVVSFPGEPGPVGRSALPASAAEQP